jgi:solute carrier family 26, other
MESELNSFAYTFYFCLQLLMFVLRLGILSSLLSECLVSGFTTGAAFHVFTSQVKDLLGLQLPRISGQFKLIKVLKKAHKFHYKFYYTDFTWYI